MSNKEKAEKLIQIIGRVQKEGHAVPCPRCGRQMNEDKLIMNSLSRYAEVYICNQCGTEEALLDAFNKNPLPLEEWDVVKLMSN